MEMQWLPVKLTNDELRIKGNDLASEIEKQRDNKERAKSCAESFKDDRLRIELAILRLKDEILQKVEMRDVEVEESRDYVAKVVYITRCDTGEIIHRRTMTVEELQRPIPFESAQQSAS
jgi:hypothetical protein